MQIKENTPKAIILIIVGMSAVAFQDALIKFIYNDIAGFFHYNFIFKYTNRFNFHIKAIFNEYSFTIMIEEIKPSHQTIIWMKSIYYLLRNFFSSTY